MSFSEIEKFKAKVMTLPSDSLRCLRIVSDALVQLAQNEENKKEKQQASPTTKPR